MTSLVRKDDRGVEQRVDVVGDDDLVADLLANGYRVHDPHEVTTSTFLTGAQTSVEHQESHADPS